MYKGKTFSNASQQPVGLTAAHACLLLTETAQQLC
jgi:hypothetical protein